MPVSRKAAALDANDVAINRGTMKQGGFALMKQIILTQIEEAVLPID